MSVQWLLLRIRKSLGAAVFLDETQGTRSNYALNFDQKVDRMESANKFIKRMTTKDTYLIGEDVLPDESLLYEKFKVLNELNMVRVNGDSLKVADKQAIYQDLFENYKHISVKKMQNYIKDKTGLPNNPDISGLSDPWSFYNSLELTTTSKALRR